MLPLPLLPPPLLAARGELFDRASLLFSQQPTNGDSRGL